MTVRWRNWSGGVTAYPARTASPADAGEVAEAVTGAVRAGLRVRAVGAGHSFSPVAATDGLLLRTDRLCDPVEADPATGLVTVAGGIPLHRLNPLLDRYGLAMENLGDIDRQTISGAVSTGTHGTGVRFGGIATQLRGLELVLADGSLVRCSADENPELFGYARVGLGAFGVITRVTLRCVPRFALYVVDEPMPLERVLDELDELVDGNDHFEFFWFPHTGTALTRRFTRLPADAALAPVGRLRRFLDDDLITNVGFEALLRAGTRWPGFVPRGNRIVSGSLSRREYTDLSYRVFASRRDVRFHEGEYAVAREDFRAVFAQARRLAEAADPPVAFPFECRFVAADDIPLAPTYERTSAYLAFHQYHRMPYRGFFDGMEAIFAGFAGRPHWGKLHTLDAGRLRELYPRYDGFVALRDKLDPTGVFGNAYLDRLLGVPPGR